MCDAVLAHDWRARRRRRNRITRRSAAILIALSKRSVLSAGVSRFKATVWRAVVRNIDADAFNFFCAWRAITIAIVSAHFAVGAFGYTHVIANVVRCIFRASNTFIVSVY